MKIHNKIIKFFIIFRILNKKYIYIYIYINSELKFLLKILILNFDHKIYIMILY